MMENTLTTPFILCQTTSVLLDGVLFILLNLHEFILDRSLCSERRKDHLVCSVSLGSHADFPTWGSSTLWKEMRILKLRDKQKPLSTSFNNFVLFNKQLLPLVAIFLIMMITRSVIMHKNKSICLENIPRPTALTPGTAGNSLSHPLLTVKFWAGLSFILLYSGNCLVSLELYFIFIFYLD